MGIAIWVVVVLFLVIGLIFAKFEHHGRKVKIILIIIIGALLYFSMMSLFSSEKVDLSSPKGIVKATYVYFGWVGKTTSSIFDIGKETVKSVGNVIKIENKTK